MNTNEHSNKYDFVRYTFGLVRQLVRQSPKIIPLISNGAC